MEQEKIEVKKHSYGKYLIIFMFLATIFSSLEQNIKLLFFSTPVVFFIALVRIVLDTSVLYFLVLWIVDLIRRRGKIVRPENKKVKLMINIIFAVIFLGMVVSVLMVSFKSATKPLSF